MFETARMHTGPDPAIELPKLFGVTTFDRKTVLWFIASAVVLLLGLVAAVLEMA